MLRLGWPHAPQGMFAGEDALAHAKGYSRATTNCLPLHILYEYAITSLDHVVGMRAVGSQPVIFRHNISGGMRVEQRTSRASAWSRGWQELWDRAAPRAALQLPLSPSPLQIVDLPWSQQASLPMCHR